MVYRQTNLIQVIDWDNVTFRRNHGEPWLDFLFFPHIAFHTEPLIWSDSVMFDLSRLWYNTLKFVRYRLVIEWENVLDGCSDNIIVHCVESAILKGHNIYLFKISCLIHKILTDEHFVKISLIGIINKYIYISSTSRTL